MIKPHLVILLFCFTLPVISQPQTTVHGKENGSALKGIGLTSETKMDPFAGAEAAGRETLDSIYAARTGTEHSFINGTEYFPYHYRAKYKPLLHYGDDRTAEIIVSGRKYDGIVLQYDTYTDEVIFSEMDNDFGNNLYQISLKRDLIGGFTLFFRTDTLRFRYFTTEETGGKVPTGFYEVAYEGPTDYIIRHRSVVHQRNGIDEYYYSPAGYVKTPVGYSKITSGGKFFKLFGAGSEELKMMVEQQGIKLRKAGKREIIRLLQAYDNQTGSKK